jgi:hypothetical protein
VYIVVYFLFIFVYLLCVLVCDVFTVWFCVLYVCIVLVLQISLHIGDITNNGVYSVVPQSYEFVSSAFMWRAPFVARLGNICVVQVLWMPWPSSHVSQHACADPSLAIIYT